MSLCVIGLGYIGLPTAVLFADSGVRVHGVDINPDVIKRLRNRNFHTWEPGLEKLMNHVMEKEMFTFSSQPQQADVFLISVPTPIGKNRTADMQHVAKAIEMILPFLQRGNLIILESTVPPNTINDFIIPLLRKSGLHIGEELFVSIAPERVFPGRLLVEMIGNDRIIGGINEESNNMTVALYRKFVKGKIHVTDVVTAEMVKLMENAYRDVNIAFANEMARMAETVGFNVWEAIRLANSHPRVHIHQPGPGVGGHCIAVDPWFLVGASPQEANMVRLARNINDSAPYHVVEMIEQCVKGVESPVVTLLGLAFKANVDDVRESPSLVVMNLLKRKGYTLKIFEPYVTLRVEDKVSTWEEAVTGSDCVVLLTDHEQFGQLNFNGVKHLFRTKTVLDTRNMWDAARLAELGFACTTIGTGLHEKYI